LTGQVRLHHRVYRWARHEAAVDLGARHRACILASALAALSVARQAHFPAQAGILAGRSRRPEWAARVLMRMEGCPRQAVSRSRRPTWVGRCQATVASDSRLAASRRLT
jgi:hypothetical protein